MEWYHWLLAVYLVIGALVAFCITALGTGVSGRPLEGGDILLALATLFLWLPYIIWKVLCFVGIFIVPMRWQNSLGILSGKRY